MTGFYMMATLAFNELSYSQMFFKLGVLQNFPIFTGKQLPWSLVLIKLQTWRPANILKRAFGDIFKTGFFYRTPPVAASGCPANPLLFPRKKGKIESSEILVHILVFFNHFSFFLFYLSLHFFFVNKAKIYFKTIFIN